MNTPALSRKASRPDVSRAEMANAIRFLAMDAVRRQNPAIPACRWAWRMSRRFSSTVSSSSIRHPQWPDRDRFVLSAGHGSMLQYALHYLIGYPSMPIEELQAFRQLGSKTAGHPEYGHAQGIETTTGPLGQGIATAVGMAVAERLIGERFGEHRLITIPM